MAEEGELGEYDELAEELADEAPEGDAAEQRLELLRLRDTPLTERARDDADPADAAEQARVVDPGDDDYR
ncbi:hypothetical protein D7294_02665 [Streptomyces hoynatensis]|uniref:Uncharacterized protein n=1 Tax=Streptomyces hoynatensis TaxID=1141874 RepID=A0A3A9ZGQ9_9ACTN|nr:hypothetical protein D7294_02665 [Streptomyces hoynatensis]